MVKRFEVCVFFSHWVKTERVGTLVSYQNCARVPSHENKDVVFWARCDATVCVRRGEMYAPPGSPGSRQEATV